jgi:heat shock protein HslJ
MEPIKKTKKLPLLPVLAGLIILIPLLVIAGCTGQAPADSRLNGTGWTLTGYVYNGIPSQALTPIKVTLDFGNEGQITGSAGCNHYFASYELKGPAITIGQVGSTEMYCTTPGVMDQESAYLTLLNQAKTFSVEGDRLTVADAKGIIILSFTRTVPPVQEPLIGTNWSLDSFTTGDAVSSVLAGTSITAVFGAEGSVSGTAGCNRYFASYNVTGTSLSISSVGSTKMACGTPGLMQQESMFLTDFGKTKSFTIKGDRLSLADAKGTTLLSFAKSGMPV